MIKFLVAVLAILGLSYLGLTFLGYQIHPENIQYYAPKDRYLDVVKMQNRIHPLIVRKNGPSIAQSLDKSLDGAVKQVLQADKFETLNNLKKDINKIQGVSDERAKQVDALLNS